MSLKLFALLFLFFFILSCSPTKKSDNRFITVGIPPQKFFVQKIVGIEFPVQILLPSNQSPATYEPTPIQIKKLEESLVYFQVGLPFEKRCLQKIDKDGKKIKIVDLRKGIKLREIDDTHDQHSPNRSQDVKNIERFKSHPRKDPHIWLNPLIVKEMSKTIYQTLISLPSSLTSISGDKKEIYGDNLTNFLRELDQINEHISNQFIGAEKRSVLIFHPFLGYFCDAFALQQIPIESKGKIPTAKDLAYLIDLAKRLKIKTIFAQPQFSISSAKAIAEEINGEIVIINPLSEDYLNNLREISHKIAPAIR